MDKEQLDQVSDNVNRIRQTLFNANFYAAQAKRTPLPEMRASLGRLALKRLEAAERLTQETIDFVRGLQ